MKKLYLKHLAIPENKKVSDNILKNRIALSIISILFCLTVMFSSAFAFFNCNLKKDFTMRAAKWEILVKDANGNNVGPGYTCPSGVADEIHEFTIYRDNRDGIAKKGYCVIKITNTANETKTYNTDSFDEKINISIRAIADTRIQFIPLWGSPVNYGVRSVVASYIDHSHTPPPEENSGDGAAGNGEQNSPGNQSEDEKPEENDDNNSPADESTSSSSESESSESNKESSSSSESVNSTPSKESSSDSVSESASSAKSESSASSKEGTSGSAGESSSSSSSGDSSDSRSSQSSTGGSSSSSSGSTSEGSASSTGGDSSSDSSAGGEE